MQNRQWLIQGNPRGRAIELSDFAEHTAEVGVLADGLVRIQVEYLSFDPSQKGQLETIAGYSKGSVEGAVMHARGVGAVLESNDDRFQAGDAVVGPVGWQEISDLEPGTLQKVPPGADPKAYLGVLGTTGLTAYFGLFDIGRPEPGDTVVVSGAAGAVGSVAGQLARVAGCRTIGIAGGQEKCDWLTSELGYDAAIDYKRERVKHQLAKLCPNGVDVFFDNVGGDILNDTLTQIAPRARVVVCGGIARYEQARPAGPTNYFNIVFRQATMEGFLLNGYDAHYDRARTRLRGWLDSGELRIREDIQTGFENIPKTLLRLFQGANTGKQLLRL